MVSTIKQELIYANSIHLNKKWYRRIFGGKWTLLKLGKDTPNIMLFYVWTKNPHYYDNTCIIVDTKTYPETNVDTKFKVLIHLVKNILKTTNAKHSIR